MFKNKHFAFFALLFSFIAGCKLFFTDDIQQKSATLLDNVNSMILNSSEKKDSNPTQNTSQNNISNHQNNSEEKPNVTEKEQHPETLQQTQTKKGELVAASPSIIMTDPEKISLPEKHKENKEKDKTIKTTAETSQSNTHSTAGNNSLNTVPNTVHNSINGFSGSKNLKNTEGETNYISLTGTTPIDISYNSYPIDFDENTSNFQEHKNYEEEDDDDDENGDYNISYNEENDDDEYEDEEEKKFNREYKLRSIKTKNNVNKALKLAKKIKNNWETVKFHKMKINPSYGIRATEKEKQNSQIKLHKFSKNKLKHNLMKLSNAIEESLNDAIYLISDFGIPGFFQKDQKAKSKLEILKTEVSYLLSKVQESYQNDYKIYEKIESSKGISSLLNITNELNQILILLNGTTSAR